MTHGARWSKYRGYAILGFAAGLIGHGTIGALFITVIFAWLYKGFVWLHRSDQALRHDTSSVLAGQSPKALTAWMEERKAGSLEQRYPLSWFGSIAALTVLLSFWSPRSLGEATAYAFLGAVGTLLLYTVKQSHSRLTFLRLIARRTS